MAASAGKTGVPEPTCWRQGTSQTFPLTSTVYLLTYSADRRAAGLTPYRTCSRPCVQKAPVPLHPIQHLREEGHRQEAGAAGPRGSRCPDSGGSVSRRRGSGLTETALVRGFTPGGLGAVSRAPIQPQASPAQPPCQGQAWHLPSSRGSAVGTITRLCWGLGMA